VGFAMIGFQASGPSLLELVDNGTHAGLLDPSRLEDAIRAGFEGARFYRQAPFIGVAIEPEDSDPELAGVSLEPLPDGGGARPSHIIALCGNGAPDPNDRTLVELPFLEFEALSEAEKERASGDLH